jgi:hypothetical protein
MLYDVLFSSQCRESSRYFYLAFIAATDTQDPYINPIKLTIKASREY